jgi:hypothetical protein
VEIERPGVERLGKRHDGQRGDQPDIDEPTRRCDDCRRVKPEQHHRRAGDGCILQHMGKPPQMQGRAHQQNRAGHEMRTLRAQAPRPATAQGDGTAQQKADPAGRVGVLVREFQRRAADQHARPDQRGGMAEHPVKRGPLPDHPDAKAKRQAPDRRDRCRVGQPEDQAARGGQDAEDQKPVDRKPDHRLARAGLDHVRGGGGNDPLRDQFFGIGNGMHGGPRGWSPSA